MIVRIIFQFSVLFSFSLLTNCQNSAQKPPVSKAEKLKVETKAVVLPNFQPFERTSSLERIKTKIAANEPLIIHVFVPLCDNEHQGIVPVNDRLGDGQNLRSNLYWGARYGVKSHFKRLKKWQLKQSVLNPNLNVLERVFFLRDFGDHKKVYLIADAYRGDRMKACLEDYFHALSGKKMEEITIGNQKISCYQNADLLVFNGHNGLMDTSIDPIINQDGIIKDAAVIACASDDYFQEPLNLFPVLTTTNLLAPEAYVLESLVENWVRLQDGNSFKKTAGKAYHDYQKCGIKGATRLFKSGW